MPSPGQIAALFGGDPKMAASLMQQPSPLSQFFAANGIQGWNQRTNNMANQAFNQTLQRTGNADTARAQWVHGLVGDPKDNPILGGWGAADIGALGPMMASIKAYHGSPHSFDKFSMSKIGSGEGAQVYGHGLYFAENPGVAQSYRDALGMNNKQWTVEGNVVGQYGQNSTAIGGAAARLRQVMGRDGAVSGKDIAAAKQKLADVARANPGAIRNVPEQMAEMDRLLGKNVAEINAGHTYEVELSPNKEDLLDWDKPISEQSPAVQESWKKAIPPRTAAEKAQIDTLAEELKDLYDDGVRLSDSLRGQEIYRELISRLKTPQAASEALRKAGIPGIKYLDQGSRGAEGGTSNFVMFDDELVKITGRK
jgi:hypothetical protein